MTLDEAAALLQAHGWSPVEFFHFYKWTPEQITAITTTTDIDWCALAVNGVHLSFGWDDAPF